MIFRTLLLATALAVPALADPVATATMLRDTALAGSPAYAIVESLTTEVGQRLAATEAEARARDWAMAKMTAMGFENVQMQLFDVPLWLRGAETVEVLGKHAQKLTVAALGRSGATPAAGVEAEVVRFADLEALEAAPIGSLTGKIAFIDHKMMRTQDGSSYGPFGQPRRVGPSLAAARGAVAVLIRSAGTDYHRNPHTGGTNWAAGVKPVAAGALSLPDAEQLNRLLALGPVRLRLVMTPQSPGMAKTGNVMGEITGSVAPKEIVVIGGHLDSWDLGTGAIDDGAGVAITMAAAKMMIDGIKAGTMPRPRRTIRVVLFGDEESMGPFSGGQYLASRTGETHVLAAESDFGADRVWNISSRVAPSTLPLVGQMARLLAPMGISLNRSNTANGGTDIEALTAAGVALIDLAQDGTRYFDYHHTPDDTLDKIDKAQIDQNVAAFAVVTWLAADSDVVLAPVK